MGVFLDLEGVKSGMVIWLICYDSADLFKYFILNKRIPKYELHVTVNIAGVTFYEIPVQLTLPDDWRSTFRIVASLNITELSCYHLKAH